ASAATNGESVTHSIRSWNLNINWDLTDWFRLRATRSRDVRAAGFRELYESYAVTAGGPFGTVTNPQNNQSEVMTALTGGNINLGHYEIRGVDFETSYILPLQQLSESLHGSLNFRLLTSLLYNMTVDAGLGSAPVDYAGQTGPTAAFGGFNTSPRWQSNFFMTY